MSTSALGLEKAPLSGMKNLTPEIDKSLTILERYPDQSLIFLPKWLTSRLLQMKSSMIRHAIDPASSITNQMMEN